MPKETFDQMLARVTAKRAAPNTGAPPKPPVLSSATPGPTAPVPPKPK